MALQMPTLLARGRRGCSRGMNSAIGVEIATAAEIGVTLAPPKVVVDHSK